MAVIRPFLAFHPTRESGSQVACKPYDVINSQEARVEVKGKPLSFLHVVKSEVDLPEDTRPYDLAIYAKAKENLDRMISDHILVQEDQPVLFIYKQTWRGNTQTGFGGCFSVREYEKNRIKKHELTRREKEDDRVNHILTTGAQTGQVFLAFRSIEGVNDLIESLSADQPFFDFQDEDQVDHRIWIIRNTEDIDRIVAFFEKVPELYIADGHHRAASSLRVCNIMASKNPNHHGSEAYNHFLAVAFPHDHLKILDYNRLIKGLNGWTFEGMLQSISAHFQVAQAEVTPFVPQKRHQFGLYGQGKWYVLTAKDKIIQEDHPIHALDVAILQNYILQPVLGIDDPRSDPRIAFVGGIRGLNALEAEVDQHHADLAFALYPTSMEELLKVADAQEIMPPKSTWFEPKLKSGVMVHKID